MKRLCDDCGCCVKDFDDGYYSIFLFKTNGEKYLVRDLCPTCYNIIFDSHKKVELVKIPKMRR
jgi:hypothetical protein